MEVYSNGQNKSNKKMVAEAQLMLIESNKRIEDLRLQLHKARLEMDASNNGW